MNVIITNQNQNNIRSLNLEIIKEMNGEFSADEIASTFKHFFYQRLILDITALKDYEDVSNLQKLSIALDVDKMILYLGNTGVSNSNEYLSALISMGIYNFTKNVDGIMYLYNNPNTYRDVAHFHNLSNFSDDEPAGDSVKQDGKNAIVIGVENITNSSGATTLTYLMKQHLDNNYSVVAIELNKRDFSYLPDKELITSNDEKIKGVINKHRDKDIVLVDLNQSAVGAKLCNEVIYLIEPSILKLNKLVALHRKKVQELKNKRIILNQSMLSSKDVLDFEYESKAKVFFNLPPLNERDHNIVVLNMFLKKLGFDKQYNEENDKKGKILGIFG